MGTLNLKGVPFLSSLFDSPDVQAVPLDSGTRGLIKEGVNRSINESPEQISEQMLGGVESGVAALSPSDEMISQEAERTGQNPYLLQAVQNKYRGETARDLGRFKTQADMQSRLLKAERMQQIAQSAIAGQQVQTNNFAMLSQAFQQNEAARASVISNIIGLGQTAYLYGKLNEVSPTRAKAAAAGGSELNPFASQDPIGGNSNPFGMNQGYGQFSNPWGT